LIKTNRRGSVLIHVLITGVIVAFIAAGLLRMVLMNYIAVDRATKGAQNRKESEAMLNRALTYWNLTNQVCANIPGGFNCSGVPGTCACTCPSGAVAPAPRIWARVVVGQCKVDLISSDPQ
jgi:Tfp pilus assembly protein PilV